jgi:hypothetical protein
MKKIVDILQYLFDFLKLVWDAATGILEELHTFTTLLGQAVLYIYDVITNLPPILKTFAYLTIFIAILFQILHREQGGA